MAYEMSNLFWDAILRPSGAPHDIASFFIGENPPHLVEIPIAARQPEVRSMATKRPSFAVSAPPFSSTIIFQGSWTSTFFSVLFEVRRVSPIFQIPLDATGRLGMTQATTNDVVADGSDIG